MLEVNAQSILDRSYVKQTEYGTGKFSPQSSTDNTELERTFATAFETLIAQDKNKDGTSFIEIARFRNEAKKEKKELEKELTDLLKTNEARHKADFKSTDYRLEDQLLNSITERISKIDGQLNALDTFMRQGSSQEASLMDVLNFVRNNDTDGDGKLSQAEVFEALSANSDIQSAKTDTPFEPRYIPMVSVGPLVNVGVDIPTDEISTGGYDGVAEYTFNPDSETKLTGSGFFPRIQRKSSSE